MLQDVAKQTPRNKGKQVYVESAVPYLRGRRGLVGYELADEGTTLVFAPTLADASVVAGVYVLDKSEIK
jgi:hypothetical protein